MAYNTLQKLGSNIAAIRIALTYKQGDQISDADRSALQAYAGFGGIAPVLYPNGPVETWQQNGASAADLKLYHPMMGLHELLQNELPEKDYKSVIDSLKNSRLTAFYTPGFVPQVLYQVLQQKGISPKRIYEPSAGAGIFVTEADKAFPDAEKITAVEKDLLTGRVLQAMASTNKVPTKVQVTGFENTTTNDHGSYDLVVSNIPFGNFSVYDPTIKDPALSGKIHNYFFAKGLDKLADGGLMAYITTDGFLNSPSNMAARQYLFNQADFISLAVMPDNLMKNTGGTEAPSHLLIVQKNGGKQGLSVKEQLLVKTTSKQNEFGDFSLNSFIAAAGHEITMGISFPGRNQYGKANQQVIFDGNLDELSIPLSKVLAEDFNSNFKAARFPDFSIQLARATADEKKKLTFLSLPESKPVVAPVQLGLFDTTPVEDINRAFDYLTDADMRFIQRQSARMISTIKTEDRPEHESIVLLTARAAKGNFYLYLLKSNVEEIKLSERWVNATQLGTELKYISERLQQFDHHYTYQGDRSLEDSFALRSAPSNVFRDLKPFYKNGTLVASGNTIGLLSELGKVSGQAMFTPLNDQKNNGFYKTYIPLRDRYLELFRAEAEDSMGMSHHQLRESLNTTYKNFEKLYGSLNQQANRRLILADEAFGLNVLSSLERREQNVYVQSDIFSINLNRNELAYFRTEEPMEALAHCLNIKGHVDTAFIAAVTNTSEVQADGDRAKWYKYSHPDGKLYSYVVGYSETLSLLNIKVDPAPGMTTVDAKFSVTGDNEASVQDFAQQVALKKPILKKIKDEKFDIRMALDGIYIRDHKLFFQIALSNSSNISYDIDQLRFYVRDQKKSKRTASQETELQPEQLTGNAQIIRGQSEQTIVVTLPKFTIPDKKYLAIQLMEKNGGRNLELHIKNKLLIKAKGL